MSLDVKMLKKERKVHGYNLRLVSPCWLGVGMSRLLKSEEATYLKVDRPVYDVRTSSICQLRWDY